MSSTESPIIRKIHSAKIVEGAHRAATWHPSYQKVFEGAGSDKKFLDPSPTLSWDKTIQRKNKDICIVKKWANFLSIFYNILKKQ